MWVIVVPATIARSTPVGVFMRSSAACEASGSSSGTDAGHEAAALGVLRLSGVESVEEDAGVDGEGAGHRLPSHL